MGRTNEVKIYKDQADSSLCPRDTQRIEMKDKTLIEWMNEWMNEWEQWITKYMNHWIRVSIKEMRTKKLP